MNIKKGDDKPIVIHTKKKPKVVCLIPLFHISAERQLERCPNPKCE